MNTYKAFYILGLTLLNVSILVAQDIIPGPKFKLIDESLNLNQYKDYSLIGQGDFNSDKFMDVILLSKDERDIKVLLFNNKDKVFNEAKEFNIHLDSGKIKNVMAADWNFDGILDMLLLIDEGKEELKLALYLGLDGNSFNNESINLQSSNKIQPFIIDYNGDMKPDLLGYLPSKKKDKLELVVWLNKADHSNLSSRSMENLFEIIKINPKNFKPIGEEGSGGDEPVCTFAEPHSNAFVDMDGDCLSDIFLMCSSEKEKSYQIWKNTKAEGEKEAGFELVKYAKLPQNVGMITFSDTLSQGSLNLVFPSCDDDGCEVNIIYNQQIPLCEIGTSTNCRQQENMCVPDKNFKLDFTNDTGYIKINIKEIYNANKETYPYLDGYFFIKKEIQEDYPLSIKVGDYNLDGYPDLLLTLENNKGDTQPVIFQSLPCDSKHCNEEQVKTNKRYYDPLFIKSNPLMLKDQQVINADWFDFFDDGTFDLLITSKNKKNELELNAIKNIYANDAFFLKTLVSNGVCGSTCSYNSSIRPYGVNQVGATIKFTVVDTIGNTRANIVIQLPQTAYRLSTNPYNLIGLGRTNNYLQNLVVGSTRHKQIKHYASWSGVIPNSQLIILPYQTEDSTDTWTRELFINPSQYAKFVLLALIISMALLAVLVILLNWVERREDEKDRKKAIHHINFDAL